MKTITLILMTASVLAAASGASARPMAHHRHQVCSMHRHHRVCVWR